MVCRAPNPAVGSCAMGQNTGQQLTYDAEGRLSGWQNVPGGSPNATASFRYDGEGERVAQQSTTSGVTTTTRYLLGGLEELTTVGSTSTLTKYYSVPGVVTAIKVGTTLSYLATDGLGSVSVALASAGATAGQALYSPYGAGRYSSGSLPTARGYTGQYQDSSSGLDYYGARYYDAALGQFTSADSELNGLDPYAYTDGNPCTYDDPTGHCPKPEDRRTLVDGLQAALQAAILAYKLWTGDGTPPILSPTGPSSQPPVVVPAGETPNRNPPLSPVATPEDAANGNYGGEHDSGEQSDFAQELNNDTTNNSGDERCRRQRPKNDPKPQGHNPAPEYGTNGRTFFGFGFQSTNYGLPSTYIQTQTSPATGSAPHVVNHQIRVPQLGAQRWFEHQSEVSVPSSTDVWAPARSDQVAGGDYPDWVRDLRHVFKYWVVL